MNCRHCSQPLDLIFADLKFSPPSNAYLSSNSQFETETSYPLRVLCCQSCWLVQTEDFTSAAQLFDKDYAYFSSFSSSWLEHSKEYCNSVVSRFNLGSESNVVEVAANDGYLLQYFNHKGIPNYGVEPTSSTASAAREKGIKIIEEFFGQELAERLKSQFGQSDLLIANNVLAHVPDINDFVKGFEILLKPDGVATFEFPHIVQLVSNNQFDTIYHEHFSYLSLCFINRLMKSAGLEVFDVAQMATHGGSLRVYCQKAESGIHKVSKQVETLLANEVSLGVETSGYYQGFQSKIDTVKHQFMSFLDECKSNGHKVAAYGAAAKGNTFLNYLGLTNRDIPYVVDLNPAKQGKFLPGSHIPIYGQAHLQTDKPDFVIILPWNLKYEIQSQLAYVAKWGGKLVTALPSLEMV